MMKRTIIYLSLSLISISTFAQQEKVKLDKRLIDLDLVLNQVLHDQKVAGFAVAITEGNKVIYSKGFGYRDFEEQKPVTPNTLFAIGSSSKAFTCALLGLLEKDGQLSLDGKATSYLPDLRFINDDMNNKITVRDLMTHRTGLSRYDYSWYLFNTPNRDSLMQRIKYMEPNVGLREKWQYNNYMFLLQGMIAEKITGKTWEQNIKEKLFIPLAMTRSNTSIYDMQKDSDASLPYTLKNDSLIDRVDYYDISGMGPAGSINSSVNDMAHWLQMWTSGGSYMGNDILPSSYIEQAASAQMVIAGGLPKEHKDIYSASYGLGWMISSYRGHYKVEHGGNIDGFSASVSFFPSDKLGIVVLSNQSNSPVPAIISNTIADRILKINPIDWNAEQNKKKEAAKKKENKNLTAEKEQILNTSPSHQVDSYVGFYHNPIAGIIQVYHKGDSLFSKFGKEHVFLKHFHYDVFEARDIDKKGVIDTAYSEFKFNFSFGNDGKIAGLTIPMDGKSVFFTFRPKAVDLSKEVMDRYVGEYILGGTLIKVYLKGNILVASVPGQTDYETTAIGNHTFKINILTGYNLQFELVNDKAVSLTFKQPNGYFKAVRKK
ncbi:serine hydrolase [Sphingobacterium faecium]|uniref:serine hydrolase n=1 Tax=Sphingobacterium faecium TaxID=34087 RepID=UPI00320B98A6